VRERAKTVSRLLKQYGVNGSQISTISYGAEIPLEPAQNEAAYAKNRRVHFALFREKK
jgi:peptidoglycan-associated lipoprotein